MIRILEIAWLVITIVMAMVAVFQIFQEGFQSAIYMFIFSGVAFGMYMLRRKQRIRFARQQEQQQDEVTRYH